MDVLDAVDPLNRLLCTLHGPMANIGGTMSNLVPFPTNVLCLPDAELLDLNVMVNAGARGDRSKSSVEARARYATSARVSQVRTFYLEQFEHVGATVLRSETNRNTTNAVLRVLLPDELETTYVVSVDQMKGYRSVKVTASYVNFDAEPVFRKFAGWHNGDAPVAAVTEATGFEVSTFSHGRQPGELVLYSTNYECAQTPRSTRRAMVDERLNELGWTYREPREGIMFMQHGKFEAETHVLGDDTSSSVTYVGEFRLR